MVRALKPHVLRKNPTRGELVARNADFDFDGDGELPAGRWRVRRVLHEKNEFVCVRLSEAPVGTPTVDNFMVCYVMRAVRELDENVRSHGPLSRRSRRSRR